MSYKTFDEWFNELEKYTLRSERFYDEFQYPDDAKRAEKWLRTAWNLGHESNMTIAAWGMPRDDGLILDVISPEEHDRVEGEYTVPLYRKD